MLPDIDSAPDPDSVVSVKGDTMTRKSAYCARLIGIRLCPIILVFERSRSNERGVFNVVPAVIVGYFCILGCPAVDGALKAVA